MAIVDGMKEKATLQGVTLTTKEAINLACIAKICSDIRLLDKRFAMLYKAGYQYPLTAPIHTGHGVGTCVKRMKDGRLRVRVSANYLTRKGWNYAYCLYI